MKTILMVESGSRAYGVADEWSDYDATAVGIESMAERMSIDKKPLEDDAIPNYDGRRFSLEKFVKLASQGNPNIVEVLYSPILEKDQYGEQLLSIRALFWSKRAGKAFLGYIKAQRERLMGIRGQKDVNRPDLVEKFGYDTKYAYHIIRLGIIGNDYLRHGHILLPMHPTNVDTLRAIRKGEVKLDDVLSDSLELERMLKDATENGEAPDNPATEQISAWMRATYLSNWAHDFILDKMPTNAMH